jgi:DNA sulfur modification protein DndC
MANSTFSDLGIVAALRLLAEEIRELYLDDDVPWVIGYSGGKDSTAVVQLIWMALADLPATDRRKPVHVITTDTLVENPIIAAWVERSLKVMSEAAAREAMPFVPVLLRPDVSESFWVNLIGRGYPAPRHKFRWCTERLKIKPSSRYIQDIANQNGEVILLLGARRSESTGRAARLDRREKISKDLLSTHPELVNTLMYMPIESWTSDDVWTFLMRFPNPWGHSNKELMALYRGATDDNECPVVVDTSTPSCGNSRFGCWVCTLVDQDKSMTAMIRNDSDKEWMLPLLDIRNELDFRSPDALSRERDRRDFRRMNGALTLYEAAGGVQQLVPGPYTQGARAHWLRRVLEAQREIQSNPDSPESVRELTLINLDELEEIRRIWVVDKSEVEDLVPTIYETTLEKPYPAGPIDESLVFGDDAFDLLQHACSGDPLLYEVSRNLLEVTRRFRTKAARRGLYETMEQTIRKGYFSDAADALDWAQYSAQIGSADEYPSDSDPVPNPVDSQIPELAGEISEGDRP